MEGKAKAVIGILLVILVVMVGGVVYALLNSIAVQNNVTIQPGVSLGVSITTTDPTTCPVLGSSSYGTTSAYTNPVAWTFNGGGSQTEWFCVENQGSGNDNTPAITLTTVPATITCSSSPCLSLTSSPATIPALSAGSVSSPISVTLSATPSTTGTGTVTITVS